MADNSTQTIKGVFTTRAAAELAIEHLVQEYSIPRTDIFVESMVPENSAGSEVSGGDVSHSGPDRPDAALNGNIQVSADIGIDDTEAAKKAFTDAGGMEITIG